MNGELIALHERLTAFAAQPVPGPEAGWADLRARLPERRRRPFWLRSRRWIVALAAAVLSSGVAYAALESGRRNEDADRDRVQRVESPAESTRDPASKSGAAKLPVESDGGLGVDDGTPQRVRPGVLPERDHEGDEDGDDDEDERDDEGGEREDPDDDEVDDDEFDDDEYDDEYDDDEFDDHVQFDHDDELDDEEDGSDFEADAVEEVDEVDEDELEDD
ncbi:MAG: hypothetical protein ACRDKB_04190 [Actinomycetota bacterium]